MAARDTTRPVVLTALVLAWVGGALMVADLVAGDGSGSVGLTTIQVLFAVVALGCTLAMLWRADDHRDDAVIDLRDGEPEPSRADRATTEARPAAVH